MRDRRDIRDRREQGGTLRGIAREIGADRNTIRRALADGARLEYSRPSMADEYEPAVHDVLADHPRLTVDQVGELVEWPGSRRSLSDLVSKVRPLVLAQAVVDLNRPTVGTVQLGRAAAGRLVVGRAIVGSVNGHQIHDPEGST